MNSTIFFSYRREDDPGFAGRLFDKLEERFGRDRLFMDVDSIPVGRDFAQMLEDQVRQCGIVLAIIGRSWIDIKDSSGHRRLDRSDDFVRIEIESALKLGKRIIPVLVNGADMPRVEALPESLQPLATRNAIQITHKRFKSDLQSLISVIEKMLEEAEVEARRRAEEEAANAQKMAKEREEQARFRYKAEERTNWDFIKESTDPHDFRDHLTRYPGGPTGRLARSKLETLQWARLTDSPEALESFLAEFPDGVHAAEAKAKLPSFAHRRQTNVALAWFISGASSVVGARFDHAEVRILAPLGCRYRAAARRSDEA
jgi:hypothetical protein